VLHVSKFPQYASSEQLEQFMGDPFAAGSAFSFERSVMHDERDEFPEEGLSRLYDWNFHHHFVPEAYGGRLRSLEELLTLGRVLSRRDGTLFLEQLTSWLGSMPIYIGGSEALKQHAARMVLDRRLIAFGLTERGHGADLLASEVRVAESADGYRIDGEKWLINGATRFGGMVVLARHAGDEDPSFFFFDKATAAPESFRHLERYRTLGFCGIDLSGIQFDGLQLSRDRIIGGPGRGLELSLKGVQLSRSEIPALSLGWADTAMRVVLDFALSRRMYGDTVFALPHARKVLADAFAQMLACEVMAIGAVRCLQVAPDQALLWQAISKYFVPTVLARTIQDLSVVLGVRFYLREEHWSGVFQKLLRDSLIAPMFDGSTVVNLSLLNAQLPAVCRTAPWSESAEGERTLAQIFSLDQSLPGFAPDRLVLSFCGREDLTRSLPAALARIAQLEQTASIEPAIFDRLTALVRRVSSELGGLDRRVAEVQQLRGDPYRRSTSMFKCSDHFSAMFTAVSCIQMWLHNRESLGSFFASGHWLVLCLHQLLSGIDSSVEPLPTPIIDRALAELLSMFEQDRLFSITPVQLASHRNRTTRA
jgi:alkylation response protein AidB-like acyl-CoA dehydrogenase